MNKNSTKNKVKKSVVKCIKHVQIYVSLHHNYVRIYVFISIYHVHKNVYTIWKELFYNNLQNGKVKETESLLY
ncbi:hypothetical protein prwr041_21540 [Prevotella herbatica]|uniref:Uncharacterized protein n=1 Tax=Prevotella herbatica TaxID=2801997 RepID=A0ABN6EN49_9BACT|nr:hypothetical protein prwr041_21540 [Prevotella herbatica]